MNESTQITCTAIPLEEMGNAFGAILRVGYEMGIARSKTDAPSLSEAETMQAINKVMQEPDITGFAQALLRSIAANPAGDLQDA